MSKIKEVFSLFHQYFEFSGASDWEVGFRCGAFFAISTILFLVVLMFLIRLLFFRKHQLRQMVMDGEKGQYIVSVAAIADLLATKVAEFSDVSLLKTKIFPARNKKCKIVMYINYIPKEGGGKLQNLISSIQNESINALAEVFGITAVETVSICVTRAKEKN